MLVNQFLLLAAVLFCIGMSIELILNSVNLNLIAFGGQHGVDGSVFALFVIAVAAAEVGVGLAIVMLIYRNKASVELDELDELKG